MNWGARLGIWKRDEPTPGALCRVTGPLWEAGVRAWPRWGYSGTDHRGGAVPGRCGGGRETWNTNHRGELGAVPTLTRRALPAGMGTQSHGAPFSWNPRRRAGVNVDIHTWRKTKRGLNTGVPHKEQNTWPHCPGCAGEHKPGRGQVQEGVSRGNLGTRHGLCQPQGLMPHGPRVGS